MRIGFDAKRAFFNESGLGNYSRRLVLSLATYYPNHEYLLYTPKKLEATTIAKDGLALLHLPNVKPQLPEGVYEKLLGGRLWRSWGVNKQLKKDDLAIYHGLSHELPIGIHKTGVKSVVTIHDLIFMRYPELYASFDRFIYTKKWMYSCAVADRIIATSEQTKQDLINFFQIASDKIEVVYQSCHPRFYAYNDGVFLQHGIFTQQAYDIPYDIPDEYILYVGSVVERKNLLTLVKAIEQLQGHLPVHLVVVGRGKAYLKKVKQYIADHKLTNQITFLTNVPSEHLPALYRCAKAFVYPSIFEGFGIPIIEALFSRIPVITSTGSCFSEVGGEHTYYVDPLNVEELSAAIEAVLTNGSLRMDMIVNGWNHAQQFTEEKVAANLIEFYQKLLS